MDKPISGKNVFAILCLILAAISTAVAELQNLTYREREIRYILTAPDDVTVQILKPDRTFVTTLFAGKQIEGNYTLYWNGKDIRGHLLPPGKYILRVNAGRTVKKDVAFGGKGFIQFINPGCVVTGPLGNVYVLDPVQRATGVPGPSEMPKLYKFSSDGSPCLEFTDPSGGSHAPKVNFFPLTPPTRWVRFADDGRLFYNGPNNTIVIADPSGKPIRSFGGVQTVNDASGKPIVTPASFWSGFGMAFGPGDKVYIRHYNALKVYDASRPGFEGFTGTINIEYPPMEGLYVGPAISADRHGRIYVSSRRGLKRYTESDGKICEEYAPSLSLKYCIGTAVGPDGMLYATDRKEATRSPGARVYQFFDDNEGFSLVWCLQDATIEGLRNIAVSSDGRTLYVLEDGENFAYGYDGVQRWPSRNIQGKARLFKYDLSYRQTEEKSISIP